MSRCEGGREGGRDVDVKTVVGKYENEMLHS